LSKRPDYARDIVLAHRDAAAAWWQAKPKKADARVRVGLLNDQAKDEA